MPSSNSSKTWLDETSFVSNSSNDRTAWIVGFICLPVRATLTFNIETNGYAVLFLSTDDSPNNKRKIINVDSDNMSNPIQLDKETK